MSMKSEGDTITCDCGFSFQRGHSGKHECADGLRAKLAAAVRREESLKASVDVMGRRIAELEQRLQQPIKFPELDSDLIDILGRPNFACIRIAQRLRVLGYEIKRRSENEQAAVLHFLLSHYLADSKEWRRTAATVLRGDAAKVEGE